MKIKLSVKEFCTFKEVANKFRIIFNCTHIKKEKIVEIEANESDLKELGYLEKCQT